MEKAGQLNKYGCSKCGKSIYTMLLSTGTTPYLLACRTPGCDGLAASSFYKIVAPRPHITVELFCYRPRTWPEDGDTQQWLLNGCLLTATPDTDIDLAPAYQGNDDVETFDQFCMRVWGVVLQR